MLYLKFILYALILYLLFVKLIPSLIYDIINFSREILNDKNKTFSNTEQSINE